MECRPLVVVLIQDLKWTCLMQLGKELFGLPTMAVTVCTSSRVVGGPIHFLTAMAGDAPSAPTACKYDFRRRFFVLLAWGVPQVCIHLCMVCVRVCACVCGVCMCFDEKPVRKS
jgi:hypothetical protein